jgi:uncharacterized membrane-anchored protein
MLASLLEQGRKLVFSNSPPVQTAIKKNVIAVGLARKGRRTKDLVKILRPGDVAVVDHIDMDAIAAWSLAERKVAAVVNASRPTSGRYPNRGPEVLASENIPLFFLPDSESFDAIVDNQRLQITSDGLVIQQSGVSVRAELWTRERIAEECEKARGNLGFELEKFTENTLGYINREKALLLEPVTVPELKGARSIAGKHVAVVVRGEGYKDDLVSIGGYLDDFKPVLIGVDGGADALLEYRRIPDIILGDMDSVSDKALRCGAKLVVHAYPDGTAPGLKRIESLGLQAELFPIAGTSEDAALLLAYEKRAQLIVAVGTHSTLESFLDKGRNGMSSTFLVRLKVGSRLVDARGVSQLHPRRVTGMDILALFLAALFVVSVLMTQSPFGREFVDWARLWWHVRFR